MVCVPLNVFEPVIANPDNKVSLVTVYVVVSPLSFAMMLNPVVSPVYNG
jgi:hypothetical protein